MERGDLLAAERFAGLASSARERVPGSNFLWCRILVRLNQAPRAEAVIRAEIEQFPHLHWLYFYLAEALEAQARLREAAEALHVVKLNAPQLPGLGNAIGRVGRRLSGTT